MTTVSNNDIARAIHVLSRDKNHSEIVDLSIKIVQFLFRKKFLSKAPLILSQLSKIINKEEGRIIAKVSSVEKIDHKNKMQLEEFLKKRHSAKEIVFEENIDQGLLGGLKIEANNEVIDFSVKNKIKKLQEHLIKSA